MKLSTHSHPESPQTSDAFIPFFPGPKNGLETQWIGLQPGLRRWVVVKRPLPHLMENAENFAKECKSLYQGLTTQESGAWQRLYSCEADGAAYQKLSEPVFGESLKSYLAHQHSPADFVKHLGWALQISRAFAQFNEWKGQRQEGHSDVFFGDLGPSQILLRPFGHACLVDWDTDDHEYLFYSPPVPEDVMMMGGIGSESILQHYAPAPLHGQSEAEAARIFRLGLLLFNLLTGRSPLKREEEWMFAIFGDELQTDMLTRRAGFAFPRGIELLFSRAIRQEPKERFGTIEELESHLSQLTHDVPNTLSEEQAISFLRGQLTGDLYQVASFFQAFPRLQENDVITGYAWGHLAPSFEASLAAGSFPPWPVLYLSLTLPFARQSIDAFSPPGTWPAASLWLLSLLQGERDRLSEEKRTRHIKRLTHKDFSSGPSHASAQTQSLRSSIKRFVQLKQSEEAANATQSVPISPCDLAWEELAPIEGESPAEKRYCGACEKSIVSVSSMDQLLAEGMKGQECFRLVGQASSRGAGEGFVEEEGGIWARIKKKLFS